jgi:hypothetical protein
MSTFSLKHLSLMVRLNERNSPMAANTTLRYFDAPEYEVELARAADNKTGGKLKDRGATRWLRGETQARSKAELDDHNARMAFEARKRYLAQPEVQDRTLEKMDRLGQRTHAHFNRELPDGYSIVPVIESKLLEQFPHLCVTQFTHIPLRTSEKNVYCSIYITNFAAEIDMTGESPKFEVRNHDYGRMFYCLAWRFDPATGASTIARDMFSDGLVFRTSEMQIAFDHTVHLTTGTKASVWRDRLRQPVRLRKPLKKTA